MDDFVIQQGSALIAHRLRRLSDRIVDQVGGMFFDLGLDVPPRGASMLLLIDQLGPLGVVEISRRLRLSHPLIVRMAREFEQRGLVMVVHDVDDARRRLLSPTDKARREAAALRTLNARLGAMFDALFAEVGTPLPSVLDQIDAALRDRPIAVRLADR